MMTEEPLADLFSRHLPEGVPRPDRQDPTLGQWLEAALQQAQEQWPEVALAAEEFLPFLAARIPPDSAEPLPVLQTLLISDLYLACACLHGDLRAVEHFRQRYFPEIAKAVSRLSTEESFVSDLQQMVYMKIFVAARTGEVKINQYSGRGALFKWIQVVALREAQNLVRRQTKERSLDEDKVTQLVGDERDPELQYIKLLYRAEFNEAFGHALTTLSSKQRNVLRYRLLEGLTIEQIGGLFHVHRMTVTRWIAAIRQQLLEETQRRLSELLSADQGEVESIIRVMQSQLDASVRRRIVDP